MSSEAERSCVCGLWRSLSRTDPFPLWYNAEMNEWCILHGQPTLAALIVRYCPSCGGQMPASVRALWFTEPEANEVSEATRLLSGFRTLDEVVLALGAPDNDFVWPEDQPGVPMEAADMPRIARQLTYSSRWSSLQVFLQELPDGSIRHGLSGKALKHRRSGGAA